MSASVETGRTAVWKTHAPASNTAAIVNVTAVADKIHALEWIAVSYDGAAPVGGNLLISIGGVTKFTIDFGVEGTWFFNFVNAPIYGGANETLTATLAAAGASCDGKISLRATS